MIQDIAPHVFHNEYEPAAPDEADVVFVFGTKKVLAVREQDESIAFPKAGAFQDEILQYLFRIDDQRYYLYLPEFHGEDAGFGKGGFEYVRTDVPEMKDNHSLTGYMIELFRKGNEKNKTI